MLMKLWHSLRKWGAVYVHLSTRDSGLLHTASPADSGFPSMQVYRSAAILLVFHPENGVRNVTVQKIILKELVSHRDRLFPCTSQYIQIWSGQGLQARSLSVIDPFRDKSMSESTSSMVNRCRILTSLTRTTVPPSTAHPPH